MPLWLFCPACNLIQPSFNEFCNSVKCLINIFYFRIRLLPIESLRIHRRLVNPRQTFNINLHEIQLDLLNEKCFFNKQRSSFTENAILSSLSAEIYCSFCAAASRRKLERLCLRTFAEIKLITRSEKVVQRFFIFRCAVRMTWRLERFFPRFLFILHV